MTFALTALSPIGERIKVRGKRGRNK